VHGWIYAVADGLLKDLDFCATAESDSTLLFERAIAALPRRQARPRRGLLQRSVDAVSASAQRTARRLTPRRPVNRRRRFTMCSKSSNSV
jgi:hypothetical protein